MRSKAELEDLFRAHGLRLTPQRACVFEVLGSVREHPSVEDIWSAARVRLPNVSLKTVYDIVHELVAVGALRPMAHGNGRARYEEIPANHSHAVCESCGEVFNIGLDLPDPEIPAVLPNGFAVSSVEWLLYGTCLACQSGPAPNGNGNRRRPGAGAV